VLASCVLILGTCGLPQQGQSPSQPKPQILIEGCDAWTNQQVCETSHEITVWAPTENSHELILPGWKVLSTAKRLSGLATRLRPELETKTSRLTLFTDGQELAVAEIRATTTSTRVEALLAKMPIEDLTHLVATQSPWARAKATDALRRRLYSISPDLALSTTISLAHFHKATGDQLSETRFKGVASLIYVDQGRFPTARKLLESLPPSSEADAWAQILAGYYNAIVDRETGRTRSSVERLMRVREIAEKVGRTSSARNATQVMLPLLQDAGYEHLIEQEEDLLLTQAPDLPCSIKYSILTNIAWARLLRREVAIAVDFVPLRRTESHGRTTQALLEQALELVPKCRPRDAHNTYLNLALAALQDQRLADAQRYLNAVPREFEDPKHQVFARLLSARVAILSGRPSSTQAELEALVSADGLTPLERWQALTSLGQVLESISVLDAIDVYRRAETLAEQISREARILSRQRSLVLRTLPSARALVDLLTNESRSAEALAVATNAWRRGTTVRASTLMLGQPGSGERAAFERQLGAYVRARSQLESLRHDLWSEPADEGADKRAQLAHLEVEVARRLNDALESIPSSNRAVPVRDATNIARLTMFPGRKTWKLFLEHRSKLHLAELQPLETPPELPNTLYRSLQAPQILDRLRVRHVGHEMQLSEMDIHGTPLGLQVGLESEWGGAPTPSTRPSTTALLLDDGSAHLAVDEELTAAAGALARRGVSVKLLNGAEASREQVLQSIAAADILHFAGHAIRDDRVLRTGLRLGDDSWITVGDVLALERVPREVILTACETGAQDTRTPSWSLAEAFVAAGANEVLATTRKVNATAARRVGSAIHTRDEPLSMRLVQVLKNLHADDPSFDWSAYRVFVR